MNLFFTSLSLACAVWAAVLAPKLHALGRHRLELACVVLGVAHLIVAAYLIRRISDAAALKSQLTPRGPKPPATLLSEPTRRDRR